MFAKRIICLLLIVMMTVCFVSCDFEDVFMKPSAQPTASPGNDSKPDDNDPLSILRYANKSDAGEENEDVVAHINFATQVAIAMTGVSSSVSYEMDVYAKQTGDSQIMSGTMSISIPLAEKQVVQFYADNDFMYLAVDGKTLKQPMENDDNALNTDIIEELISVQKAATSQKKDDGSFEIELTVDLSKATDFLDDYFMFPMMDVSSGIFETCKVKVYVDASYEIKQFAVVATWTETQPTIGSITYTLTTDLVGEELDDSYEIKVPDEIDIDNAVEELPDDSVEM